MGFADKDHAGLRGDIEHVLFAHQDPCGHVQDFANLGVPGRRVGEGRVTEGPLGGGTGRQGHENNSGKGQLEQAGKKSFHRIKKEDSVLFLEKERAVIPFFQLFSATLF